MVEEALSSHWKPLSCNFEHFYFHQPTYKDVKCKKREKTLKFNKGLFKVAFRFLFPFCFYIASEKWYRAVFCESGYYRESALT